LSESREGKLFNKDINDDELGRKKDYGQLRNWKIPPLYALEHRVRRKERQAGEALKTQVKLT
jgi:hypothetical protein